MKQTGIIRRLDALGRVVIPKELRTTLQIDTKDGLEIFTAEDTIILRRYEPLCYICGGSEGLKHYRDNRICSDCIKEARKLR